MCLLTALPLLCCSRVGYEPIFEPDGLGSDARDDSDMDAQTGPDGDDGPADPGDPGLDAGDPGIDGGIDAADQADAGDPGPVDAGGDEMQDGGDAGDQDPDPCGVVDSYVESFSIISTEFVEVPGSEVFFTPAGADEKWLVLVSAAMASNYSGAAQVEANYTINGVEAGIGGFRPNDPWMEGAWQHFALVSGTAESQRVAVGLREGRDGYQATILRLRVIAFKLPASADVHYVSSESIQSVTPAVWQTYQSLDVNPMIPGMYFVMSSVSARENPGANSIGIRLVDPDGYYWPQANPAAADSRAFYVNHRYPWRSYFVARGHQLSETGSFRIEANGSDPGGSEIYYSRILAFRTNSFRSFASTTFINSIANNSATPMAVSSLPIQLNSQECPQLAIQSMFVWTDLVSGAQYVSDYLVDGSPVASYSESFAFGFCAPFGAFHLLSGDGTVQLENVFYLATEGFEAQARESSIHVMGP